VYQYGWRYRVRLLDSGWGMHGGNLLDGLIIGVRTDGGATTGARTMLPLVILVGLMLRGEMRVFLRWTIDEFSRFQTQRLYGPC